MLLTITTTHQPATDLGYLLHKHPAKIQSVDISNGVAHIFYPEATSTRCTAALLLDINPISLIRNEQGGAIEDFTLARYVNDKPYIASSLLSVAIAKAYASALNGRCKDKPELVDQPLPLEIKIAVLSIRGGEDFFKNLFEPLGYQWTLQRYPLDTQYPEWGDSRYYTVTLQHTIRLCDLLSHLYILIPVLDNAKHYWIGKEEIDKLLEKGKDWLPQHPYKEVIIKRYLKNIGTLAKQANFQLPQDEVIPEEKVILASTEEILDELPTPLKETFEKKQRLHDVRLETVKEVLKAAGVKRVVDLGCGEGKLIKLLLKEKQFEQILGMDVSHHSLQIAQEKLYLDNLAPKQKERIKLVQGSLTYTDKRLLGYDAAALVEVIEHLELDRLEALVNIVFGYMHTPTIVITTPNAEYNEKYEKLAAGAFRHTDHRFEWTRAEFEQWANEVATQHQYTVKFMPLGEEDLLVGGPSQMGIFTSL